MWVDSFLGYGCFGEQDIVLDTKGLWEIVTYVAEATYATRYVNIIVIRTHICCFMAKSEGM